MGFSFNKDAAQKAGDSDFITESGFYKGVITSAIEMYHNSGAQSITFSFRSDDGKKANFMRIITIKKDGTPSFGHNMVMALMGLLQIREANPVSHDNGDLNYDCFCNRPITLALQRVNTPNQKYQFRMNILHFIDPVTFQTYKEKTNNTEPKTFKTKIEDDIDMSGNYTRVNNEQPHNDDDCPF